MHLWLMGIAWQSNPPCCIPNEETLIRFWLKKPDDNTWKRVWPQIQTAWKKSIKNPQLFIQVGLLREYKKIRKFSKDQTDRASKRWASRRINADAVAYATAEIRHQSGNANGRNARAGNALHSAEVKTTSLPPSPKSSPPQAALRCAPPDAPAPLRAAVIETSDERRDCGHEDFLALGLRNPEMPTDPFGWTHLENSLSSIERVESKMREKLYCERKVQAVPGGSNDVF